MSKLALEKTVFRVLFIASCINNHCNEEKQFLKKFLVINVVPSFMFCFSMDCFSEAEPVKQVKEATSHLQFFFAIEGNKNPQTYISIIEAFFPVIVFHSETLPQCHVVDRRVSGSL